MNPSSDEPEQRWGEIRRAWRIGPTDTRVLEEHEALTKLAQWLEDSDEEPARAVQATQVLLADPEDPAALERASVSELYHCFSEEAWRSAGTSERDIWVLQGLLIAAWPKHGAAANVSTLLDLAWLGRRDLGVRRENIGAWREMVAGAEIQVPSTDEAELKASLQTARSEVRTAMQDLINKRELPLTLEGFGPSLSIVLRAIWVDMLSVAQTTKNKRFLNTLTPHIEYITENETTQGWMLNHFGKQLKTIIGKLSAIVQIWDCHVPWDSVRFFDRNAVKGHNYNGYSYPLLNLLSSYIQALQDRKRHCDNIIDTLNEDDEEPCDAELDLLWWGQASYSYRLRSPFRIQPLPSTIVLIAAIEAAEHSSTLAPDPAAAFLVQTLANLGLDVFEKRTLADWMLDSHETLSDLEIRNSLTMSESLAELVDDDSLGLPVSFIRRLTERNKPFDRESARQQVGLDLDIEIDRGDWASWLYREWRLDFRFGDDQ